jgi:Mlc titration factor MtfA (ptsG expression regulator)
MIWSFKNWRRQKILERESVPEDVWREAIAALPLLRGLSPEEIDRLRELVILFLHDKTFSSAAGLELTDRIRLIIAAQACLLVLNLGLDYYAGWKEVIVYPDEFIPRHEYTDEAGVVHISRDPLMGESWLQGPVILSAEDAQRSGRCDGVNVVIHEFAHKLDMLNGEPNGFPPLHRGMSAREWTRDFTGAYEDFRRRVEADEETEIDPYAAENPGEFFAVLTEAFFETPHAVKRNYPAVYRQLAAFYRQDPAARMPNG